MGARHGRRIQWKEVGLEVLEMRWLRAIQEVMKYDSRICEGTEEEKPERKSSNP